ncbi:hypothetical protein [uncultured Apibacter sp.]|uniref:hypothetical protein n=1 Tax=uncultured Apibacter sp. TaxID=1778616 RepID=UPI0025F22521|nr:hypothetical protein [uncultured Apibacter sp.]
MKKKNIKELYTKGDIDTSETIYYLDKYLIYSYSGLVIDEDQGVVNWEFKVVDGKQNGMEKVFYSNGNLEQISEYKNNLQFGLSKEYDEDGNLTSVAVVWNNGYLKTIYIVNNKIAEIEIDEKRISNLSLPDRIKYLLLLNNEDLICYKFE